MEEHYDMDGNVPYWTCKEWDSGTDYDGYCYLGERRNEHEHTDYDFTGEGEDKDRLRIATLGEIRGICQMANAMKEVLRS